MLDLKALQNFNWRSLQKYTSPQAAEDLNHFLEKMPQNAGQTMLIIAGIAWSVAGVLGLYTTVQIQKLTEFRAQLQDAAAIKPIVPIVRDVPVDRKAVEKFVERTAKTYNNLEIEASGASITIRAKSTALFGQFREAMGHVQNGGSGWRVNIDSFCVGRECDGQPLGASLKINKVSVEKPG